MDDPDANYDVHEEIDLARLEPLIANALKPWKRAAVREVAGREIYQTYVGSSALATEISRLWPKWASDLRLIHRFRSLGL